MILSLIVLTIPLLKMNKIDRIQHVLNKLYPNPPVPLNYNDAFTFLCAVVLSAQTTDGKVNQVTSKLFQVAPDPLTMSQMDPTEVEKIIKVVGLAPKKSSYLVNLSKMLVETFDGKVPSSFEDLESLPGVGHKTASVVMSQIYGYPTLAVDTHVHRLALRWKLTKELRNPNIVQKDLCQLFPQNAWSKLHLQMIYFGREYCTAKQHQDKDCPICSWVHSSSKSKSDSQPSNTTESSLLSSSSSSSSFISDTAVPIIADMKVENKEKVSFHSYDMIEEEKVFTPKKTSKGIIFYSAREDDVKLSPSLTPRLDFNLTENSKHNTNDNSTVEDKLDEKIDEKIIESSEIKPKRKISKKSSLSKESILQFEMISEKSELDMKLSQKTNLDVNYNKSHIVDKTDVDMEITAPIKRGKRKISLANEKDRILKNASEK